MATLTLALTHILVLTDDETGARIIEETPVGQDFRALCHDLAGGHIPAGMSLHGVRLLDDEAGRLLDNTRRVLNETRLICEARNWSAPRGLIVAFAHYDVPLPVSSEDVPEGYVDRGIVQGRAA